MALPKISSLGLAHRWQPNGSVTWADGEQGEERLSRLSTHRSAPDYQRALAGRPQMVDDTTTPQLLPSYGAGCRRVPGADRTVVAAGMSRSCQVGWERWGVVMRPSGKVLGIRRADDNVGGVGDDIDRLPAAPVTVAPPSWAQLPVDSRCAAPEDRGAAPGATSPRW